MSYKVEAECGSCDGTGLYHGFMEKPGDFVVCVPCGGTGSIELRLNAFTGRKRRNGVKRVRAGSGTILDNPSEDEWMSYEEFRRRR